MARLLSALRVLVVVGFAVAACADASDDAAVRFVVQAHVNCFLPDGSGNPPVGDDDEDGFCNDEDTCPLIANNQLEDADGDGVGDRCDPCFGDESTGDGDLDGYCTDVDCDDRNKDVFPGAEELCDGLINDCDATTLPVDEADSDGDFVPDCRDLCEGADGFGDRDGDGICEDLDLCLGDNATGDDDGDGVCGDRDVCRGDDAAGDTDTDGVCNDVDVCEGDDALGDDDDDGVCNDVDVCEGNDASGDDDDDGVCNDVDVCAGDDRTGDADGDGFCADRDCDDDSEARYPGAPEVCDGEDDDCDRVTDDGAPCEPGLVCAAAACTPLLPCYADRDGDGFGDADDVELLEPGSDCALVGRVSNGDDCDDDPTECGAACAPGQLEQCDLQDRDCDGDTANGAAALCVDPENGAATCRAGACVTTCATGFVEDAGMCVDVDECVLGPVPECGELSECSNTFGGAECVCVSGAVSVDGGRCVPVCGDGRLLGDEGCDDGGTADGDGCSAACQVEAGWACDGLCAPVCGDGLLRADEGCDDGDTVAGDGCDEACRVEFLWACEGEPSRCSRTSVCGNGALEAGETCDDANLFAEDGCDTSCQVEEGWTCVSAADAASACTRDGGPAAPDPDAGADADEGSDAPADDPGDGGCAAAGGASGAWGGLLLVLRRRRRVR